MSSSGNPERGDDHPADHGESWVNSHGAEIPQGVRELPGCLKYAAAWFYGSMLHPDDDFEEVFRKKVLCAGFLVGVNAFLFMINDLASTDDWSVGHPYAALGHGLLAFSAFTTSYLYARCTGCASAALMDIWVFSAILAVALGELSNHTLPWAFASVIIFLAAVFGRTSKLVPQGIACIIVAFWSGYDRAAYKVDSDHTWAPLLALPSAVSGERFFDRVSGVMILTVSTYIVLVVVALEIRASDRMVRQTRANSTTAMELVELLAKYDTTRALQCLDEAGAEAVADERLLSTFRKLVDHLNDYRPHLPNWILPSTGDDEEDEGSLQHDMGDDEDDDDDVKKSAGSADARSTSSRSNHGSECSSRHSAGSARRAAAGGPQVMGHAGGATKVMQPKHHTVMAVLHFRLPGADARPDALSDIAHDFADAIFERATQTSAAVHSLLGDCVTLTWNATGRVMQPESKMLRCLCKLRADAVDLGVRIGGGACSGSAHLMVAGQRSQQSLMCSGPWQGSLNALAERGRRAGVLLVDQAVATKGGFTVPCRPAGALCVQGLDDDADTAPTNSPSAVVTPDASRASSAKRVIAFEPTQDVSNQEGEWMYVMAGQDENATSVTKEPAATRVNKLAEDVLRRWAKGASAADLAGAVQEVSELIREAVAEEADAPKLCAILRRDGLKLPHDVAAASSA